MDGSGHGVYDLADAPKRKGVHRAKLVQTGVLDAHSPFVGFFSLSGLGLLTSKNDDSL